MSIPIKFSIPAGMVSRYAHHMLVQETDNEVTLSFFELKPPLVFGDAEKQLAVMREGVLAECVSRVTVAKAKFPDFVKAMAGMPSLSREQEQDAPPGNSDN